MNKVKKRYFWCLSNQHTEENYFTLERNNLYTLEHILLLSINVTVLTKSIQIYIIVKIESFEKISH